MALLLALAACGDAGGGAHQSPAQVANSRPEGELATITLTEQAERRLGIETDTVALRPVSRTRLAPGDITVPAGRSVIVSAPLAGTVIGAPGGVPAPGTILEAGRPVFRLVALPTDLGTAREAVAVAEANARLWRARARRARELRAGNLVSEDELESAEASAAGAEATFEAARARLALVRDSASPESLALALPPLEIPSPIRGILQRLLVAANQRVSPGQQLFEVADMERLWVRVPVYVGDLTEVDQSANATVQLGSAARAATRTARPVRAPPSANALAASADLYYELPGSPDLRPGQRVMVLLPLRGREPRLVAPWSSVIYDINGGAWVYQQTAPHVFARRRVEVAWVSGDVAVLSRGPAPGARVVTAGVAELFGTEFGGLK